MLHFALVLFLCLCLLDIAFLALDYSLSLQAWQNWEQKAWVMLGNLLLWELILIIALSYLFLQLLRRYQKYKERTREYQRLLLQAVTHKLGNFLAAQRVDYELVRETGSSRALQRMEQGRRFLEKDFRNIVRFIKDMPQDEPQPRTFDLAAVIQKILADFPDDAFSQANLNLQPAEIKGLKSEIKSLIYILLENASRYSASKISISSGTNKHNRAYLWIKNDVDKNNLHGTGVGLETAKKLAKRNKMDLLVREREDFFLAALVLKK